MDKLLAKNMKKIQKQGIVNTYLLNELLPDKDWDVKIRLKYTPVFTFINYQTKKQYVYSKNLNKVITLKKPKIIPHPIFPFDILKATQKSALQDIIKGKNTLRVKEFLILHEYSPALKLYLNKIYKNNPELYYDT